jgi:hypothetical protein
MKVNPLAIVFVVLAIALVGGIIAYKSKHHGGTTAVQPPAPAVAKANAPKQPAAPPAPTAPATTIKPVKDALKEGILNPIFFIETKMQMLKRGIMVALNSRQLKLEDFEKLSFDATATTDPYNVFNPNGVIRYAPMDGVWLDQSIIDRVTSKKGSPLVFNVRRVTDQLGTSEILYAVIPNIAVQNCGVAAGSVDYSSQAALTVEPDTHTIVDDPPGMPVVQGSACIHMPDGRVVWLYNLKMRYKHTGETRWGSR